MTSRFDFVQILDGVQHGRVTVPHEEAMISIGYWPAVDHEARVIGWGLPKKPVTITDEAAREAYRKAGVSHVALYWLVNGWRKSGKVWRKGNGYMNEDTATSQFMRRDEPVPF